MSALDEENCRLIEAERYLAVVQGLGLGLFGAFFFIGVLLSAAGEQGIEEAKFALERSPAPSVMATAAPASSPLDSGASAPLRDYHLFNSILPALVGSLTLVAALFAPQIVGANRALNRARVQLRLAQTCGEDDDEHNHLERFEEAMDQFPPGGTYLSRLANWLLEPYAFRWPWLQRGD